MPPVTAFKAYDIRGQLDHDLNDAVAYGLGRAYARRFDPGVVVIGRDTRASSPTLAHFLATGLTAEGVDVIDIGLCGTEEVYHATDHLAAGGGIMVTASHNPIDYNGFKLVGPGAAPILPEEGFLDLKAMVAAGGYGAARPRRGTRSQLNTRMVYARHVCEMIDPAALRPMKVLVNAGNGTAGPTFDAVARTLRDMGAKLDFVRLHHDPDPAFPNGIPNPLLPENQPATAEAVRKSGADLGIAWDGDFDRCFLFDETGAFVPGEYIVGLIASAMLVRAPGARIVHDPRVQWATQRIVKAAGGTPVAAPTGHALVKAAMRAEGAAYGGEMSAHHYFREFMYCDSGMIPWLMVIAHLSRSGQTLGQAVAEMRAAHPSSGEINTPHPDPDGTMARVEASMAMGAHEVCRLDGLSMAFDTWRFNLRKSNTEPLLRLNVETLGDPELLERQTAQLLRLIRPHGGTGSVRAA
ncbi:MAG: phosphomannomutase [Pseudomonadota bacterium]